nr:MAG TPA: hypothetical protein [Caudoviricetes sp.]
MSCGKLWNFCGQTEYKPTIFRGKPCGNPIFHSPIVGYARLGTIAQI